MALIEGASKQNLGCGEQFRLDVWVHLYFVTCNPKPLNPKPLNLKEKPASLGLRESRGPQGVSRQRGGPSV